MLEQNILACIADTTKKFSHSSWKIERSRAAIEHYGLSISNDQVNNRSKQSAKVKLSFDHKQSLNESMGEQG